MTVETAHIAEALSARVTCKGCLGRSPQDPSTSPPSLLACTTLARATPG